MTLKSPTFEVRLWVCVSNEFNIEQILAKMIGKNVGSRMEELQREVRNMIEGRKYLIVLDDVWDENHNKWVELRDFLMLGGNGSRVLTTTRSKAVAGAIGKNHTHELQGLSDEHSWQLFKKMAFEEDKTPVDSDLVDIGKEVVKKCANVPLSIRVVGSLLYGQHKEKWISFKSINLRNLGCSEDGQAEDGIMPILKYSYYHLSPSLKSCFSYCALFPKDFEISKKKLIWLWMSHGCLDLLNDGRTMEAVGADYFSILLHRCFFHIEQDVNGQLYKMHDLMHDLALEVAGKESLALETAPFQVDKNIRHLSIGNDGCKLLSSTESCLSEMKKLRSLRHNLDQSFYPAANESNVKLICSKINRLRVLDLSFLELETLPNTIGNLSHLRYLDLSLNHRLEILPESITKLQNLIVLNLLNSGVKELPKGLRKLLNLRHLHLDYCSKLTHMPTGMDGMTGLQTLSKFVVAGKTSKQAKTGRLKDLRSLVHLIGRLEIIFKSGFSNDLANAMEGDCLLSNKVHLEDLALRWEDDPHSEHGQGTLHEILLEGLRPHCSIRGVDIWGYKGKKIPSWVVSLATFFPCLVRVSLHGLDALHNLPSLSQLLHLKVVKLWCMPNVEFIESDDASALFVSMSTTSARLPFFPSLEVLYLDSLPKLKGVWSDEFLRMESHRNLTAVQSFPRLHKLDALHNLPSLSQLLHLKVVKLWSMPNVDSIESDDAAALSESISITSAQLPFFPSLEKLYLSSLPKLKGVWSDEFLRMESHRNLTAVQSFPRLHKLEIRDCPCLTAFPRCPRLKTLVLLRVHESFRFLDSTSVDPVLSNLAPLNVLPHSNDESSSSSTFFLDRLDIDKVELVNLLFGESLKGIYTFNIHGFQQEILSAASDLFQRHASSVRSVCLYDCYGLKNLCRGGIEHLTNLRYLSIGGSVDLDFQEGEVSGMTPWKSLKNLGQLDLWRLSKLTYLPEGVQQLTSLHTLTISECNLESLPEWLSCLTSLRLLWLQSCTELKSLPEAIRHMHSLRELRVWYCNVLADRCREPDGQDWPKISHIHILHIKTVSPVPT